MNPPKSPKAKSERKSSKGSAASKAPPVEPGRNPSPVETTRQRLTIDASFVERADLRAGLRDNLVTARADADTTEARVVKAFEAFDPIALPAEELDRRHHVERGQDPSATLDRVATRWVDATREAPTTSALMIQRAGAAADLIKHNDGVDGVATIQLGPLMELIERSTGELTTLPSPSAGAKCVAEKEADRVLAAIEGTPEDGKTDVELSDDGEVPDDADARGRVDEFVERSVSRQMRSASAPEVRPEFSVIPNGADGNERQAALLDTFELRPGASDVTSYHDFSTLQIAFEHVWTQIFDKELETLGRHLYREYVGLKDFLGYESPDRTIGTLEDLRGLMERIRELSAVAESSLPDTLGGGAPQPDNPKGVGDLGKVTPGKVLAAAATGGLSVLVELAIKEFGRMGQKPVLSWETVSQGRTLNRGDRIRASVEHGAVSPGLIEIVLQTDVGSHYKEVAFQRWIESAGQFQNVVHVGNSGKFVVTRGGGNYYWAGSLVSAGLLPVGMLQFSSEESPGNNPGRYVLGGLDVELADRDRAIFYWTDS